MSYALELGEQPNGVVLECALAVGVAHLGTQTLQAFLPVFRFDKVYGNLQGANATHLETHVVTELEAVAVLRKRTNEYGDVFHDADQISQIKTDYIIYEVGLRSELTKLNLIEKILGLSPVRKPSLATRVNG